MVKVGDSIPNVDLVEASPSDKVNLSKELASGYGNIGAISSKSNANSETCVAKVSSLAYLQPSVRIPLQHLGVPAWNARQLPNHKTRTDPPQPGPSCSATHIPGYVSNEKLKNAGKVFVVSVNDPFVYVTSSIFFPPRS